MSEVGFEGGLPAAVAQVKPRPLSGSRVEYSRRLTRKDMAMMSKLLLLNCLTLCLAVSTACTVPHNGEAFSHSNRILQSTSEEGVSFHNAKVTFPFALGNTWVYSGTVYAGFNATEIFTATYVVTESVVEIQSHPPYTAVRVHRQQTPHSVPPDQRWWSPEKLTKVEDYWYVVDDTTVYWQEGELDLDTFPSSTVTSTSEIELVFPLEVAAVVLE